MIAMPQFAHGGDIKTYGAVLDFSANLNPLGMPQPVLRACADSLAEAGHYPDPFCRAPRTAIAGRDGVPFEHIVCGNGAADLIFRLCLAIRPKTALICAPTFSEYEQALTVCGCAVRRHTLRRERGFELGRDYLAELQKGADIAFLCTPNNPTGRLIDRALLAEIAEICSRQHTLLVLDECFIDLSDDPRGMTELLQTGAVLLRAFTKSYAMPGLRFGYALCADSALRDRLDECAQPWSVSCVAQAAAVAACSCPDWPERGRELIAAERPKLIAALRSLGLEVWDGQANYLLFRSPGDETLKERLVEKGVLIRSCANYPGLDADCYRVAVRPPEENSVLLTALREVL